MFSRRRFGRVNKAMRGMIERLLAEPAIIVAEETTTGTYWDISSPVAAQTEGKRPDLVASAREKAKAIAAERVAGQPAAPAVPAEPAMRLPTPLSAAIEPRPLAQEPKPGTPVASNPVRPKPLTDEERQKTELERIAQIQKRMAIARQRSRRGLER